MKKLDKSIVEKYSHIEDKIPSIFKTYEEAAISLAQAICMDWDINEGEIIRVITLLSIRTDINLTSHIDFRFSFCGLYPEILRF